MHSPKRQKMVALSAPSPPAPVAELSVCGALHPAVSKTEIGEWLRAVEGSVLFVKTPPETGALLTGTPFLCTHNGSFHCDEALALAMLKVLPAFRHMPVVRTRDPAVIAESHLVVDVGGKYEHASRRYDHHMGDFVTTYSEKHKMTKLSSAGLVYKHYGREIVQKVSEMVGGDTLLGQKGLDTIVAKLYRNLIEEVDAIDNGVEPSKDMKYRVGSGIGSRVKRCNPSWRVASLSAEEENKQFVRAMTLTGVEFYEQLFGLLHEWYPARKIVEDAFSAAEGQMMFLPTCCPWQEHLADIEAEPETDGRFEKKPVLYVIFPDTRSGSFRIQAVPKQRGSFENRKPLPAPWRGVRDAELSGVTGIPGSIFVHASGFIGGNQTLEGAKEMGTQAVEFKG